MLFLAKPLFRIRIRNYEGLLQSIRSEIPNSQDKDDSRPNDTS